MNTNILFVYLYADRFTLGTITNCTMNQAKMVPESGMKLWTGSLHGSDLHEAQPQNE